MPEQRLTRIATSVIVPEGSFVYSYIQTEAYTENAIAGPGALDVSTEDLNGFIPSVTRTGPAYRRTSRTADRCARRN